MTGTAKTEEEELRKIYGLDVYVIPTNKPMIRQDLPDVVYKTEAAKYRAVVREMSGATPKRAARLGGHRLHREIGAPFGHAAQRGHPSPSAQCQTS